MQEEQKQEDRQEHTTTGQQFTPTVSRTEAEFLEGPHSRWEEFRFVLGVMREFISAFRKLHFVGPCVTVFGSARFTEQHRYYMQAREVGAQLAGLGFTVMTGGGPGIMEAANRGARDAGGSSIGCNIILPKEQHPNKYLDRWVDINYFFVRKTLLMKYSYAFVVMPGGYGTLDEFFNSITLIQTGKIQRFPIVLMGKSFHQELFDYMQNLVKEKTIDAGDLDLFLFTDSVSEAMAHIEKYAVEGFKLKIRKKIRPAGILGEKKTKSKA
jgi:uncharacterized protein (TIGR00730 family)